MSHYKISMKSIKMSLNICKKYKKNEDDAILVIQSQMSKSDRKFFDLIGKNA